jgi:hypothetical protein
VIFVSLRINDALMSSSVTGHTARRTTGTTTWAVSWLGDRQLTRNQAITALTLAELVAAGVCSPQHPQWPHIRNFAAELDLTADNAIYLIKEDS